MKGATLAALLAVLAVSVVFLPAAADNEGAGSVGPGHTFADSCDGVFLGLGDACFQDFGILTSFDQTGVACGPGGCIGFDTTQGCVYTKDDLTGLGLDQYECAGAGTDDLCSDLHPCPQATFTVGDSPDGSVLRVAASAFLATPQSTRPLADPLVSPENNFDFYLYPPGTADGPPTYRGNTLFAMATEILVGGFAADGTTLPAPEPGEWTARIVPRSVIDMNIQIRARLAAPGEPTEETLLPNLRIGAPFEIGFHIPTNSFGAAVPNAPVPAGTCMAEEREEAIEFGLAQPVLCLRFSLGVWNEGEGPLSLLPLWAPVGSPESAAQHSGTVEIPMVQRACRSDSRGCEAMPAPDGLVAIYHKAHGHLHFQNAYVFELFRVTTPGWQWGDAAPSLEFESTSAKLGVNPGNEAIAGWDRFYQLPADYDGAAADTNGGNCIAPLSCEQRLQAGWGDFYDYNRGGNYVPFPVDALGRPMAGMYLIRGVTDRDSVVVETNENDNTGYALFEVGADGSVELLERGFGDDPWDNQKQTMVRTPG